MEKLAAIYEGKAKIVYSTANPNQVIQYFKDDATAFNGLKKEQIAQKGILNNQISSQLLKYLGENQIPTHFIKRLSDREMLIQKVKIIPLEVVYRNRVAGSLHKKLGQTYGKVLPQPIIEFYYKDDALGDPMVSEQHILSLGWATAEQLTTLKNLASRANHLLTHLFAEMGILLVDGKLEFGVNAEGQVILADEISPDVCRLWDAQTKNILDKDRFRQDLGKIEEAYAEIAGRVNSVLGDKK